jgi:glycosyltransferase involved in cell wall biosynthesis
MSAIKVSVVISIYNSHEIVRRQALHFARMNLPDDVEFVLVDDGSEPELITMTYQLRNLRFFATHNKLAWTQGLGRNLGAEKAAGEYLLLTDIDHILSREAIEDVRGFTGAKMIFRRQIAVLDAEGRLTQKPAVLSAWGYDSPSLDASVHGNTFVMPRAEFLRLGGYDPKTCTLGYHPVARKGDDCYFNAKWNRAHRGEKPVVGHDIYMFPIGRFHRDGDLNPQGLFHDLHQREEVAYKREAAHA